MSVFDDGPMAPPNPQDCAAMKFGKTMRIRIKPSLQKHAVDYKALKQLIAAIAERVL